MLTARWRGEELGSGTDAFRLWDAVRSGELSEDEFLEAENHFARSAGHCMVMGTASTMAAMAEAMGMTLPGCACIPAADSRRLAIAEASGREIVSMVHADIRPSKIVTGDAIENAIRVDMAIGGSTNAVVHLLALAGRLGLRLELDDFDRLSRSTPCIVDLKPSGERYMEDLYYAGGIPAVMREIQALLHLSSLAVNGKSLGDNIANAEIFDESVIRSRNTPLFSEGGTVVLRGNLAPQGAVLKQTAASRHLLHHRGKALVFNDRADMYQRIDSLDLPVTKDSVLVLKHAGPLGGPGMPEWGNLPVPQKLLDIGVKDVVRISDGRMSGTAFGTVVLHIAPESAIGGPLAYVQDGDFISLDVANRRLDLEVEDDELARRRASWRPEQPQYLRGYGRLFLDHVLQADRGCDFDFLVNDGIDNARDDAVYFAELGSRQSSRQ